MPTTLPNLNVNLHTAAGLRWLAPFLAVIAVVTALYLLMLSYPHITG
ncbi:MAG TPA: hypothetical protein VLB44_08635 [Kofleriaceae bacterium]|nr:hypothetical protein [Kofleriaceae bacterium]